MTPNSESEKTVIRGVGLKLGTSVLFPYPILACVIYRAGDAPMTILQAAIVAVAWTVGLYGSTRVVLRAPLTGLQKACLIAGT